VSVTPAITSANRLTIQSAHHLERPWILLEVTRRCNRACLYCYAGQSINGRELSTAQLDSVLARLVPQVRPRGITLIGGEPLLHDELAHFVKQIAAYRIPVALSTNGLVLTRNVINELVKAGLTAFEISFDCTDSTILKSLTGTDAPRLQRTLTEAVQSGVTTSIGMMLTKCNLTHVADVIKLCFALGIQRISLNQMALVGSARDNPSLIPTDEELGHALANANREAATFGMHVSIGLPIEPCRFAHDRYPALKYESCGCGFKKWLIEPSGDVRFCELSTERVGNLFEISWQQLVTSPAVCAFRKPNPFVRCQSCAHWENCRGGCRFRGR
jgi:mycofactocin biosynthetic radical S-adenosylmethionine protein MftC